MNRTSRLVLQNWSRGRDWDAEQTRLRGVLEEIGGVHVVSLDGGSGLIEVDTGRARSASDVKAKISNELPEWKVYEESRYHNAN